MTGSQDLIGLKQARSWWIYKLSNSMCDHVAGCRTLRSNQAWMLRVCSVHPWSDGAIPFSRRDIFLEARENVEELQ